MLTSTKTLNNSNQNKIKPHQAIAHYLFVWSGYMYILGKRISSLPSFKQTMWHLVHFTSCKLRIPPPFQELRKMMTCPWYISLTEATRCLWKGWNISYGLFKSLTQQTVTHLTNHLTTHLSSIAIRKVQLCASSEKKPNWFSKCPMILQLPSLSFH